MPFTKKKRKKKEKERKEKRKQKIQTLQNYIPHFNGRCSHFTHSISLPLPPFSLCLSLSLSLFLTSCRTSACLLLLHQGPFPPPCQLSVLATTWPPYCPPSTRQYDVAHGCSGENLGGGFRVCQSTNGDGTQMDIALSNPSLSPTSESKAKTDKQANT